MRKIRTGLVSKWWPGLIPVALIWIYVAATGAPRVEADLTARSETALKEAILNKTQLTVAGRDVALSAEAFSEEGRRSAVSIAEAVAGVRQVQDSTQIVPEASPFTWSATREVARLILRDHVPLPAIRARLADAARAAAGSVEVADEMNFARGAPPRFDAVAQLLLEQVGRLKEGRVALAGTKVSVTGMARELGGREAIGLALQNLPEGYTVAENAIKAPPYVFQANKDPVAATVILTGYVPDNAAHSAIVAAAKRKFVSENVVDNLKSSIGAPPGFVAAATAALTQLARLGTGALAVSDRSMTLTGDALYPAAGEQIRAALGGEALQGWDIKAEIAIRPGTGTVDATVCQQLFAELLGRAKIRFESGRATIDTDSLGLLDRLVETAFRCPSATIVIAGHTDADGDDQSNLALSEKRANAVADYLVKAGIASDHLKPVGYGRSRPVAPNDSEEGKAQNRRIEFLVQ